MKKAVDNIRARIEAREASKEEKLSSFRNGIKLTEAKIEAITAELEEVDDPEKYKSLSDELKEEKLSLNALQIGYKRSQADGSFLPKEDYKEILNGLQSELDSIQAEHAPKIDKKLSELIALMDEYADEADELQDLANRAHKLYSRGGNPIILDIRALFTKSRSPLNWLQVFTLPYFEHRELIKQAKKNPQKVLANKLNNPELLKIAEVFSGKV